MCTLFERAVPGDRGAIIEYLQEIDRDFPRPLSSRVPKLETYVDQLLNRAELILARRAGRIVGLAAFYANNWDTREAYLAQFAVARGERRKGFGSGLIRRVLKEAEEAGMKAVRLEVDEINRAAIGFYRHFGFRLGGSASSTSVYMWRTLS